MALDTSIEQQATLLYEKEVQIYLSENLHLLGGSRLELIQTEYPIKFEFIPDTSFTVFWHRRELLCRGRSVTKWMKECVSSPVTLRRKVFPSSAASLVFLALRATNWLIAKSSME